MSFERAVIEDFLYREARLMDSHAYDEWLALWDQEAHYWIPANADDANYRRQISLVNEDRGGIEDRIARLKSGAHYAQDPRSRLCRAVSNVEIEHAGADEIYVHSTVAIIASRKGRMETYAGRILHRLRPAADGFRIRSKKVLLVNNDEVMQNITFLI